MIEEKFKKDVKEFRETRLTVGEKSVMLENIFKAPIESPYVISSSVFNIFQKPLARVLTALLVIITSVSIAYTAEMSEPGEALYAVKTAVFEPILDQVNTSPVEKLEWEEKKIERRIAEAEELAERNKLDEEKTLELEKKIKKSSNAFANAALKVASSTATTTEGRNKKAQALKESFKKKLEEKEDEDDREKRSERSEKREDKEKIKRLKDRAIKALEEDDDNDNLRKNSKGRNRDD